MPPPFHRALRADLLLSGIVCICAPATSYAQENQIIHDAEYYILEAQNGNVWAVEDGEIDAKLAELKAQYGTPPNLIHLMWDDQPFGAVGIPAMQQIRGYETPNLNELAAEGMLFTRMYTEPSCTPTRAAAWTGQYAVRSGMEAVGFPVEYEGIAAENVTIAEVLSDAGYATGFFGKTHLGDLEESFPHKQGYDEAFFSLYNQSVSLWNVQAEAANAVVGLKREMLAEDRYVKDNTFVQEGYVFYAEGEKGGATREWCGIEAECYRKFDDEARDRTFAFIRKNAEAGKPFYAAWWPLWVSFLPEPQKVSLQRGLVGESYEKYLDPDAGQLVALLKELGIAENTLLIAMSDNGPMTHNPPAGAGLGEGPFRGGKGDFLEGGVRVSAQAWWPGVIEPGQIAGDIVHVSDLFTTFARLAGALENVPTDRVIDGVDQTSLLLNGDGYSRRDNVMIYSGPNLGASVKDQYKTHWIGDSQAETGLTSVYDLYNDHREVNPIVVGGFHFKEPFRRMRARHELWIEKYPHMPRAHGPAYGGIENARPETIALTEPPEALKSLPFEMLGFIDQLPDLPYDSSGDVGVGDD
ncbi:sulfatase-like hydrolase/transferase [Ruegeria sp. A3M17]|uniref:sulfatase-like hydrolase/transferase n=1 Tax=Ruegeria sp. A3M17 TaxID=2267229 RepID=UPI000DE9C678|nr:sulfatase-like hydrolase/transferase [Ruegeria sp. A3M17]RBW63020.1 sulfatase [Ruegeria sp. A3M17]